VIGLNLVLTIYLADRLSKFIVMKKLFFGESIPVLKSFFHITLVGNTGAAFGMFKNFSYFFLIISIVAVFLLIFLLIFKNHKFRFLERISLCFVLAGTLGNLTDRLQFGFVVDFIDFRIWPVFNLADSFITAGAFLLAWSVLFRSQTVGKGQNYA